MSLFHDLVDRFTQSVTAYVGDKALMLAAVSAASNVIVADSEVDDEEVETALAGMRANPILQKGYDTLMLETELFDGIARARTRAGRAENLGRVAAIVDRDIEQRNNVFLIAADVADHEGISDVERKALAEVAAALAVDMEALLRASPVKVVPAP
ncbi:Tellurite resistance protein TerB [Methylobacterium sp. Leaf399]|uniref:tellurite resistance TerB family protein n=1 Tax=unclassified Methylobacterium TaxID=2615210 RepID=UPI0006F71EB6|nr:MULTISPECIES: tellurite resistance TerB family protein [unclassified Methylobacterium]KQP52541.1 Tellurite resistance protein TerB [Methylobacterium sp. Leaf108]KQT11719.1 Tellurite resistance protein TerB [Methylobacterium sp. Leaf399]KQT84252.1 Tellurite resistance protein TerB [Methylobacterium sp. Leaf466]